MENMNRAFQSAMLFAVKGTEHTVVDFVSATLRLCWMHTVKARYYLEL